MRVLVTGASGFIGRNLCANLARLPQEFDLMRFDTDSPSGSLTEYARQADFVVHLAGVNRPRDPSDFQIHNTDLTRQLLLMLRERDEKIPFMLASSTQATMDNPYGLSKRAAEDEAFRYAHDTGAPASVFRFPGVFGKWCRPFYNNVVATFCYQTARGEPLSIADPDTRLTLLYIDDLVDALIRMLRGDGACSRDASGFCYAAPLHTLTLGCLADTLRGFAGARSAYTLTGDRNDPLTRKLYATFITYLPEDGFAVTAKRNADARGDFTELIKSEQFGQVSISRTLPGITRGQHWHNTKVEKFIVIRGEGVIRFRRLGENKVLSYPVSGKRCDIVDIPPGYTHSIENTGQDELLLLLWAGELFDQENPDTYFEEV